MKNIIISISLVISSIFIMDLSAQNLCNSLLLYYPFNGNANDASGHFFNGNIVGATITSDRFGNPNSAYYFRGNTDYIDLPLDPLLKPQLPFSVAFWVMFPNLDNFYQIFTSDYYEQEYTGCWVGLCPYYGDTLINISYGDGGIVGDPAARRSKIGTTHINKNQWYHITAVFRGPTDMDIYLNGINENGIYDGYGNNLSYSDHPGSIGRHCSSTYVPPQVSYMNGKVDDVAFWNRALTQEDVTELYTVGISAQPTANFTYNLQAKTVVFTDQSIHPISWLWDFGDGYFSNLENPVHAYDNMRKFYVCLTVTNPCGTDQYCDTVFIQPNGITEFTKNLIEIYPNPATNQIYIKGSNEFRESGTLQITNTQGLIMLSRKIEGDSNNINFIINVKDFESGLYYLKIILNTRVLIRKFIIIHNRSK